MFQTAIVAIEDDWSRMEPVIESAVDILGPADVDPILLHVFPKSEFKGYLDKVNSSSSDPDEVASRHNIVQRAADRFHDAGLEPKIVGAVGDPSKEIVNCIEERDVDHVFMGGRQRSAAGKVMLGSVSQKVLKRAEIPCTITMS